RSTMTTFQPALARSIASDLPALPPPITSRSTSWRSFSPMGSPCRGQDGLLRAAAGRVAVRGRRDCGEGATGSAWSSPRFRRSAAPALRHRQGPSGQSAGPAGRCALGPRGASSSSAARGPLPEGGRGRDDGEGAVHPPEAVVLAGPRGVGGVDVVPVTADEVPPHQDRFGEGLPADEHDPGGFADLEGEFVAALTEVAEASGVQG